MKTLLVINTVYQLFITINMRVKGLPQEDVDIAVSDHTPMIKDYMENLKESGLFNEVFYIESLVFDKYFWALSDKKSLVASRIIKTTQIKLRILQA